MSFALFIVGYVVLSVVVTSSLLRFFPGDFELTNHRGYRVEGSIDNLLVGCVLLCWPLLVVVGIPFVAWGLLVWLVRVLAGRTNDA